MINQSKLVTTLPDPMAYAAAARLGARASLASQASRKPLKEEYPCHYRRRVRDSFLVLTVFDAREDASFVVLSNHRGLVVGGNHGGGDDIEPLSAVPTVQCTQSWFIIERSATTLTTFLL